MLKSTKNLASCHIHINMLMQQKYKKVLDGQCPLLIMKHFTKNSRNPISAFRKSPDCHILTCCGARKSCSSLGYIYVNYKGDFAIFYLISLKKELPVAKGKILRYHQSCEKSSTSMLVQNFSGNVSNIC